MNAFGTATWHGSWKQGAGTISTQNEGLKNQAYTYASRFEGTPGASPEELLAAAHAGCYNQALANIAGKNGLETASIDTTVAIDLGFAENGNPEIKSLHFTVRAAVPNATEAQLQDFAEKARVGCTISKILKLETTVSATLIS